MVERLFTLLFIAGVILIAILGILIPALTSSSGTNLAATSKDQACIDAGYLGANNQDEKQVNGTTFINCYTSRAEGYTYIRDEQWIPFNQTRT